MPTLNEWRGDAPAVAQIVDLSPPVNDGLVEFYIGGRPLGYNAKWNGNDSVYLGAIVARWNASTLGEFKEIVASGKGGEGGVLRLTAREAGRPFAVTTTVGGLSTSNEIQTISLSNATGGTFILGFAGAVTSAIAYNASAAAVQSALEALSAIDPGDITVAKVGSVWTVTFKGQFLSTDVPQLGVNYSGLTGGTCSITITPIQSGAVPINCLQLVSLDAAITGGTATLTWNGATTSALAYNASAATVQTAVDTAWGAGNTIVTGSTLKAGLTFEFTGNFAGVDVALITGNGLSLTGGNAVLTVDTVTGGVAGTNQSNNYKLNADPSVADSGGRTAFGFYIRVDNWRTAALAYTSSAATIQSALNAMTCLAPPSSGSVPFVGDGNVAVTGTLNGSWVSGAAGLTITFGGRYHSTAIEALIVSSGVSEAANNNSTIGATRSIVTAGAAGTNETQRITQATVSGTPGRFRIVIDGIATDQIEYCPNSPTQGQLNTWAAQVKTALSAHPSIGTTGDMTATYPLSHCTGPYPSPGLFGPRLDVDVIGILNGASPSIKVTWASGGQQSKNITQITVIESATSVSVVKTVSGFAGLSEIQTVAINGSPWGGTWTLNYSGQTTSSLSPAITAGDLRLALEALSNLVPGDVSVSGSGPWTVTFAAALGDVPALTATATALRNGNVVITTQTQGGQTVQQVLIQRSRGPWHFNDPLNWTQGRVPHTADIPWHRVGATGPRWGLTQLTIFTVSSADATIVLTAGDFVEGQAVLVRSSGTLPTGLAVNTTYYVRDRDIYGMRLSASLDGSPISLSGGSGTHEVFIALAGLKTFATWTGGDAGIGNYVTDKSGKFREYRATYLRCGWQSGAKITLSEGSGSSCGMVRIDSADFPVELEILGAGGPKEQSLPAVMWIGSHSSNLVNNYGGDLGVALLRDEVSSFGRLNMRAGATSLGPGVTVSGSGTTIIDVTGGKFISQAALNGIQLIRG